MNRADARAIVKNLSTDVLLLLLLALSSWLWVRHNVDYVLQPDAWDEAGYIEKANHFFENWNPWLHLECGPLYMAWYSFLGLFERDPLKLYFLNGTVLSCLIPLATYIFGRRWGLSVSRALAAALLMLFFAPLILISRWSNHFGLCFLLLGFSTIGQKLSHFSFLFALAVLMLITSTARPEAITCLWLILPFLFYFFYRDLKSRSSRRIFWSGGAFLILAGLTAYWGFYGAEGFANRSKYAFQDWTEYRLTAEVWPQPPKHFVDVFGKAQSTFEAAQINPQEFLKHVSFSARRFVETTGQLIASYRYIFESWFGLWLLGGFIVAIAVGLLLGRKGTTENLNSRESKVDFRYYALLFLLVVPTVVGSMIFGETPRHLLPLIAGLVLLIVGLLPSIKVRNASVVALIFALTVAIACACARPDFNQYPFLFPLFGVDQSSKYGEKQDMAMVLFVRGLGLKSYNIITSESHLWAYLDHDAVGTDFCWNRFIPCPEDPSDTNKSLAEFLEQQGHATVLMFKPYAEADLHALIAEGRLKKELIALSNNAQDFAFEKFRVPCSNDVVYVAKSAIPSTDRVEPLALSIAQQLHCVR